MMETIGQVQSVLAGKAVTFHRGEQSAINKTPITGAATVTPTGLDTDEQADKRFHGGLDKALHLYPSEHYQQWMNDLGENPVLKPGGFGENLSTTGLTEQTIHLGDKVQIGSTLLELSEARMPCWKLNDRFSVPDMALRVQCTLRSGWYFRVLEAGQITAGDNIILVDRPHPQWPLSRLLNLVYQGVLDKEALQATQEVTLQSGWQRLIDKRIETGTVEDWMNRLFGGVR